jgi:hypothetical protein
MPEAISLYSFRFDAQADGTLPGRFWKREDHAPHYGRSLGQVHIFEGLDPRLYHFGVEEDAYPLPRGPVLRGRKRGRR